MASNRWDENVPSGSSAINLGDDDIRSLTTSLRIGLDDEHHWDSTTGSANRGTHRYGSARAWLDVQSNLSQSGTSYLGRLFVASDTSRLFAVPSSGLTMFLGGCRVIEYGSAPSQNTRYVHQTGTDVSSPEDAVGGIIFSPAYDSAPHVVLTSVTTNYRHPITATIRSLTASVVTYVTHVTGSGASALGMTVHYHAVGPVTF